MSPVLVEGGRCDDAKFIQDKDNDRQLKPNAKSEQHLHAEAYHDGWVLVQRRATKVRQVGREPGVSTGQNEPTEKRSEREETNADWCNELERLPFLFFETRRDESPKLQKNKGRSYDEADHEGIVHTKHERIRDVGENDFRFHALGYR